MKNVIIKRNGGEYTAVETRNITAANKAAGKYDMFFIKTYHNGLVSKFVVKPHSFWSCNVYAGSFRYDMEKDKITYFSECDYNFEVLFVFKHIVNVLQNNDILIICVKRGRIIERYKIGIGELKPLIGMSEDKYGLYPVFKHNFEKLKSKVRRGNYAKK